MDRLLDPTPFHENYAKLYFDAKHLKMGLSEICGALFFEESLIFSQYWTLP